MSKALTGIERQLVIQYLSDGNAPITITQNDEQINDFAANKSEDFSVQSAFPVVIEPKQFSLVDQEKIVLQNPPQAVQSFVEKDIKVLFYFNKLGLYFTSKMQKNESFFEIPVPEQICKIEEKETQSSEIFSAFVNFSKDDEEGFSVKCVIPDDYELFSQPHWNSIPAENQKIAKEYLEKCVMYFKSEEAQNAKRKSKENAFYLIPLCRFLAAESDFDFDSAVQGKKKFPLIIYIDYEKIVFGFEKESFLFEKNCEYSMILSFPIHKGPVKTRKICLSFEVCHVFSDDKNEKKTAVCFYNSIKEEDVRFLEDFGLIRFLL